MNIRRRASVLDCGGPPPLSGGDALTPTDARRATRHPLHRLAGRLFALALLFGVTSLLDAEPLIVGFDRFHSAAPTAEGGRLLFNELGCASCHGGDTGLPARRGPALTGVTHRVHADWLRAHLADPAVARPGTAMPHLLHGQSPDAVEAVVHYLGSIAPKAAPKVRPPRHANAKRGEELFHQIGCVACHAPGRDFTPPEGRPADSEFTHRSVEFPDLAAKYVLTSLSDFLRDPLKHHPDGRMPRFMLEEQDAIDLAAHLLGFQESNGELAPKLEPFNADATLAKQGRALVAGLRCAACHDLPKDVAAATVLLNQTDAGCLSASPAAGVPRYDLSDTQRSALKLFLAERNQPAAPALLASLTLEALNCLACHDRDGRGGPDSARKAYFEGDHNLGDTGRYPPPLTGVGRKLQPDWFAKVLTGEARVRPYLKTQMPVHGAATASLASLLAKVDAKPETPLPAGDLEAGRKLLGTLGGNSCITCHRWGERASLGIQSTDLANLAQRIQPGWLHGYLIDPAAYRPGTLMPSFWPGGTAANQEILGGDTAKQIAAIYAFAKNGKGEPEGFPETSKGEFELIPAERPIVQRAFIEGIGTHAILVGFPQGVHLAYDGLRARPAMAWKGRFFDAYGTWFMRFVPFEKPLGESIVQWPAGGDAGDVRFLGYRLDGEGVPTFLWSTGDARVEERFVPVENGLKRTLRGTPESALRQLHVEHPEGVTVSEAPTATQERTFIYTWK